MQLIHRTISTHIINKAGFTNKQAKIGAVTLIQRFGSALNLNIHFHMLFLEGAIIESPWGNTAFTRIKAPSRNNMVELVHIVSYRIAIGLQQGQKVFTLQTLPANNEGEYGQIANTSGFSLHAGTSCRGVLSKPTSQRN